MLLLAAAARSSGIDKLPVACIALTQNSLPARRPLQPAKAGGGFGVIHLLLVALLAFLVSAACCLSCRREHACQAAWRQPCSSSGPVRSLHAYPNVHLAPGVCSEHGASEQTPGAPIIMPACFDLQPPTRLCASPLQVGHFANVSVPLLTDWLHSIVGKAAGGSAAGNTEL